LTGNDIGSLPPGSALPNSTSATASPPSVPGYHASSRPGTLLGSVTQPSVSGRPFMSTTTNGLPVAAIAWTSASCWPGRLMSLRADAAPLSPAGSPTTPTVTSEALAASTAWLKSVVSLQGSVTVNAVQPSA